MTDFGLDVTALDDVPQVAVAIGRQHYQCSLAHPLDSAGKVLLDDEDIFRVARDVCHWRPYLIARVFSAYGWERLHTAAAAEPMPLQMLPAASRRGFRSMV